MLNKNPYYLLNATGLLKDIYPVKSKKIIVAKTNTIITILIEIKMLLPDFVLPSILSNSGKFSMFLIVKNS